MNTKNACRILATCVVLGLLAGPATLAETPDLTKGAGDLPEKFATVTTAFDHTRIEAMIPMRDGVKLNTVILVPKGAREPMPIVMTRTPYNLEDYSNFDGEGASPRMGMNVFLDMEPLTRHGYILAFQDVRGKNGSEGQYVVDRPARGPLNGSGIDHATDTWDTIEWLLKNVPGNNGRVGITGISYDGFLSLMPLLDPHPALRAAIPVNAMVDGWMGDDWYHNGALRQTMIDWVYTYAGTKDSDLKIPYGHHDLFSAFLEAGSASEFGKRHDADRLPLWRRIIDNPAYTPLWEHQAVQKLLAGIELKVPTMTVHSLFDQEDIFGPIASYTALEKSDRANDRNYLVIGPWYHGQTMARDGSAIGKVKWGSDTARYFREKVQVAFFDEHLKGRKPARPLPPVLAFETGANEWREYDAWPPRPAANAKKLYLQPSGGLAFTAPSAARDSYTEYVSDPARPVPYRLRPITAGYSLWNLWLADDQRHVADRPDVVNFVSERLSEPLTISGEAVAHLLASTTGTDADWVVKLIDLYPDEYPQQLEMGGYQLMVAADIFRGRYREGSAQGKPVAAGKVLPYRVPLPHANHTFLPGHRIMVQIQSTWFPLYDRNPQTFVPNVAYARPEDFRRATHRIHHSAGTPSFIELPVQ